jgi:hypothetical protein
MCSGFKKFPDLAGIIYTNCCVRKNVNKEMYIDNLCHLRNAVRRKPPEKWRTNCLSLLLDNAPAHRSVLVKDFLANSNVTTLKHPLYSSELASVITTCSLG